MASELIAIDSEPIRARGMVVKYFQFHSVQSSQTSFSAAAYRDKSLNMPNVPEYN